MNTPDFQRFCEAVYREYHHPELIAPDPLELVLPVRKAADREIVAFIASSFALGRVSGIKRAVQWILSRVPEPAKTLPAVKEQELSTLCRQFRYRFFTGEHLAALLTAIRRVLISFGSLEACFAAGVASRDPAKLPPGEWQGDQATGAVCGLSHLVDTLHGLGGDRLSESILIAHPNRGSACKRLWLFLRWIVRNDVVDPGGWTVLTPASLLVPLDTHMLRICRALRLTDSRQATIGAAREVTARFRTIAPEDPARFDFSLTRIGIHPTGRSGKFGERILSMESELAQLA